MAKKEQEKKSGGKQVRIKLSNEQYAELNELKFKEKLIDTPIAEYARSIFLAGLSTKKKG